MSLLMSQLLAFCTVKYCRVAILGFLGALCLSLKRSDLGPRLVD